MTQSKTDYKPDETPESQLESTRLRIELNSAREHVKTLREQLTEANTEKDELKSEINQLKNRDYGSLGTDQRGSHDTPAKPGIGSKRGASSSPASNTRSRGGSANKKQVSFLKIT